MGAKNIKRKDFSGCKKCVVKKECNKLDRKKEKKLRRWEKDME